MANNTIGEKELLTKWPVEKGLIAETTSQKGRKMYLTPENSSNVRKTDSIGIR